MTKTYSNKGSEVAGPQGLKNVKARLADKKRLEIKTSDVFKCRIRYFTDGLKLSGAGLTLDDWSFGGGTALNLIWQFPHG